MRSYTRSTINAVIGIFLLAIILSVGFLISAGDTTALFETIRSYTVIAPLLYVLFVTASVVFAPFSSLPLIPIAAGIWGITTTSVLSILGWWIGALIAFEIAHRIGRPALLHFVQLDRLDAWIERFSGKTTFFSIILIRMLFPVEIPSYALGLLRSIPSKTHAIASLIGITPFGILMTMMGAALIEGRWITLVWLGAASIALFAVAWHVWSRYTK